MEHAFAEEISAKLWASFPDEDEPTLAQAIVDAIREPLLVLDGDLRVVTANRSFYLTFDTGPHAIQGMPIYALGDGEWSAPELRLLLEKTATQHAAMEAYEIEQDFSGIGRRTMRLSARELFCAGESNATILLSFEDITEQRAKERELNEVLQQKDVLLRDMQHRVANSLQIIASILLIKARTVRSEETRLHLQDAHQRVMSVAAVQQQLQASASGGTVELAPYLSRLCETLAASMIGDRRPITLKALIEGGTASSSRAISIGLIVTELVINAFKHAFPDDRADARVTVSYEPGEPDWRLAVSDNGIGQPAGRTEKTNPGLGTTIIQALAKQLDARVYVMMEPCGTTVSIVQRSACIAEPGTGCHAAAVARWDNEGGAPSPLLKKLGTEASTSAGATGE